ncbi:hypothetical protein [Novipirellula caenicola]|uniref:Zinc finger/thioredoxin putative domain-containing protein n=1 Tax=Novipirellula caenicola TaxID=1536901 RepID=A0ABP9VPU5_9BACT
MSAEVITVVCRCGQRFRVKSAAIGRQVKCPKCKTACDVVAPPKTATPQTDSAAADPAEIPVVKGDKQLPPRWQGDVPDFSGLAAKKTPPPSISTDQTSAASTSADSSAALPEIVVSEDSPDARAASESSKGTSKTTAAAETEDVPEFAADELSVESEQKADPVTPAVNPYTAAQPMTSTAGPSSSLPQERKYPMLELIRKLYFALAWLILGLAVLYTLVIPVIAMTQEGMMGLLTGLLTAVPILIASAVWSATLLAGSEVIKLFLDIQSNTLATANAVQSR